jgi:serine/threonine-protein kinase
VDRPRVPLPHKLGPFVVGAKVGGGGMASVYLGRRDDDTHPDLKLVALKVIRDDFADDPKYREMFDDEAKILSRFAHPGIIRHVDYGHAEQHSYLAMELVLGRSLMDAWDACAAAGKRMPVDLGAYVALQVADALAYAHAMTDDEGEHAALIHRDVNPTNIFLTYDGQVKLLDFGLAKARGRKHESVRGIIKGKVAYFAPEQITEDIVDHRIDIYALGATLWETTTGRRLFKRDNDVETVRAIQAHVIPDPRSFVEGLYPESLWRIIERALQKHPSDRYGSAREMAEDGLIEA